MQFDHILFIGFGGPTSREELEPFLENVTRGRQIPPARLTEVIGHYEAVGGKSPYNEHVFKMTLKVESCLEEGKIDIPIFVGMRHWHPFLHETITTIKRQGLDRGLAIILAPHRTEASCARYKQNVKEALAGAEALDIRYTYLKSWHDHPFFVEAQADEVKRTLEAVGPEKRKELVPIFTAHSIPRKMLQECDHCDYARRVERHS